MSLSGLRTAPHELYIEETGPDFVVKNLNTALTTQRFSDVKFVCKGGKVVSAHVAVMASVSPFLKKVFKECTHPLNPQPLIISLPDAFVSDIQALVNLIYSGKDVVVDNGVRKSSLMEVFRYLQIRPDIVIQPMKRKASPALVEVEPKIARVEEETTEIACDPSAILAHNDDDEEEYIANEEMGLLEPKTELMGDDNIAADEDDDFGDMEEEERAAMEMLRETETGPQAIVSTPPPSFPLQLPRLPLPPALNMSSWQPMPMPQALSTPSLTVRRITPGPSVVPQYSTATKAELDARTREILEPKEVLSGGELKKCEKCKCPNCEEKLLNPMAVGVTQNGISMHRCHYPDCAKQYKKTSHLRSHLRSHIGDQPFVCTWDGCERRFTRSDELHRHFRIHTGEKNHQCPHCESRFSRSDHLKKHVAKHFRPQPNIGIPTEPMPL